MSRRHFKFKKSYRDQLMQSADAQRYYATFAPDEKRATADAHVEGAYSAIPAKRERAAPKPSNEPTEAEIQRAILNLLKVHPKVAFAGRFNRGMVPSSYTNAQGQTRESYTQFNTLRGFPDIHGCLKGGKAIYIEVKRPGRKPTEDQAEFLERAATAGAFTMVATSADQVAEALR